MMKKLQPGKQAHLVFLWSGRRIFHLRSPTSNVDPVKKLEESFPLS
jgi:hypothetical protein